MSRSRIYLLAPVQSAYGTMPVGGDVLVYRVPLLPGAGKLEARLVGATLVSPDVSFTVQ